MDAVPASAPEPSPVEMIELARKLLLKTTRVAASMPIDIPFNDPKLNTLVSSRVDAETEMRAAFDIIVAID